MSTAAARRYNAAAAAAAALPKCEACAAPAKFRCPKCDAAGFRANFCTQQCYNSNFKAHKARYPTVFVAKKKVVVAAAAATQEETTVADRVASGTFTSVADRVAFWQKDEQTKTAATPSGASTEPASPATQRNDEEEAGKTDKTVATPTNSDKEVEIIAPVAKETVVDEEIVPFQRTMKKEQGKMFFCC